MIEIGVVTEQSDHWEALKAYLEPAAKLGGIPILEPHELVWAVLDEGRPVGAATARLTTDNVCEVVLVGGKDHRKWLGQLDERIGACAAEAGARTMRAFGRRGWARILCARGWERIGEQGNVVAYERRL